MAERRLIDQTMDLAVNILKHCEMIKGHYSLKNQIERSATSIGANIHEAQFAQGSRDFISKLEIALKECNECDYWLNLLNDTESISREAYQHLISSCSELRRMLVSSVQTMKAKQQD